jgi:hypothetical protein
MQFHSRRFSTADRRPRPSGDLRRRRARRRRKDFHFRGGHIAASRRSRRVSAVLIARSVWRSGTALFPDDDLLRWHHPLHHKRRKISRAEGSRAFPKPIRRYEKPTCRIGGSARTYLDSAKQTDEREPSASSLALLVSADSRRQTSSLFAPDARAERSPSSRRPRSVVRGLSDTPIGIRRLASVPHTAAR